MSSYPLHSRIIAFIGLGFFAVAFGGMAIAAMGDEALGITLRDDCGFAGMVCLAAAHGRRIILYFGLFIATFSLGWWFYLREGDGPVPLPAAMASIAAFVCSAAALLFFLRAYATSHKRRSQQEDDLDPQ